MNKIAIIVGSTRPGRRAGAIAQWVHRLAESHGGAEYTVLDLADFALPMLDEAVPAAMSGNYQQDHTKAWATAIGLFDGYIFVTPEYNHSITGALKNALDYLYEEWGNKAAAFVGYGTQGGTRAVEHLRHIASELGLAHVRSQVELSIFRDFTSEGIASTARLERSVIRMIDELNVWTQAMRIVRGSLSTPGDAPEATAALSASYAIK